MLNSYHSQKGVSLIESMIALVVISVGLLGIAALQLVSLQQNSSSQWHSKAVWFSYEMTDRILANNTLFDSYSGVDTSGNYDQDCQANSCTSAQMVNADAEDWKERIEELPSGRGIISQPNAGQLLLTVMWDDDGTGATGTKCSSNTSTDLTCYSVTIVQ